MWDFSGERELDIEGLLDKLSVELSDGLELEVAAKE